MAADVEITSDIAFVNLDAQAGSTAHVAGGVTVGPSSPAISATSQAWTVTNDGTVSGGNAVRLDQGGTFTNAAGASVSGTGTAITFGYKPIGLPPAGGPGTLNNYGSITGGVEGVTFWYGGTVNNYLGGVIKTDTGLNAVSIGQGTSRTLYNEGTIEANRTTGFSTGVLIQGGPASFTNTSTGVIFGGYNGVYTSATGVFTTFENAGSIRSTRGAAVEATGGGNFTNSGTIASTGASGMLIANTSAAEVINSGTISGAVYAIDFASGSGVVGAAHTLRLRTGSALNGNVRGGTGTDYLVLEGSGSENIGKFLAFENLTMQGTSWTLNGAGTFSTNATVALGALNVAGTLTSPNVLVSGAGRLEGNGTIAGAVRNEGTIAAGSGGIGTLRISGSATFAAGSVLEVDVTEAGANDVVDITGAANIQGGTVRVVAASGMYTPFVDYTILRTTAGRAGVFEGATSNYAFLGATLSYDAFNVYLRLERNGLDFSSVGQTFNQISTAGGVEALGSGQPVYDAVVVLDEPTARSAFDQLSGEVHASIASGLMDESRFLREAMLGRAPGRRPAPGDGVHGMSVPGGDTPTIWTQAYGAASAFDGDGNAAGFKGRSAGLFIGADSSLDSGLLLGGVIGVSRLTFDVADRASEGDSDNLHIGLYGAQRWGGFGLNAGASYTLHSIDTHRHVQFQGFDERLRAGYHGYTGQVFADASYAMAIGGATFEPFVRGAYVGFDADRFAETGGAAALSSSGESFDMALSTLGVRGSARIGPVTFNGMVGWQHTFGDETPQIELAFAGQGGFPIRGAPVAKDMAVVDAGLEFATGPASKMAVAYSGRYGDGVDSHSVKADFQLKF